MSPRRLALVANFHRERLVGRKSADFVARAQSHLAARGVDLEVEFVLDRPDDITLRQIEEASRAVARSRLHVIDQGNLGAARCHGVAAARAEVVCFLDGDDYFSMNWFEAALDHLSGPPRREVVHTQYMVGFDRVRFVRETVESADPAFDPLALAVDWYWSANLAVQTEIFAASPIEPYDHQAGFGSEDWDWACNSLAAGVARVSIPGTSYYYRVKPRRFALGRVGDVIHKASPLFAAPLAPPPAAPVPGSPPVAPLSHRFFAQAREIEPFEVGLSYLREVEAGALEVPHYKPHTPPIVGAVWREAMAAGFGDGAAVVFADAQRLPGGLPTARALCDALAGRARAPRLYVLEGEGEAAVSRPCPGGYILSVDQLRASRLFATHIARLVARFFIQARDIVVLDLLSPRVRSTALSYSRATRGGVERWIAVVLEHGFDAFSRCYDELDAFEATGVACERVALFAKTADEAARIRGVSFLHDAALEAAFVEGRLERGGFEPRPWVVDPDLLGRPSPAESRAFRLGPRTFVRSGGAPGGLLLVDQGLRSLADRGEECVLVSGAAILGLDFPPVGSARPPGLRIPALTVIDRDREPTLLVRHSVARFADALAQGRFPMDLSACGALGIDAGALRDALDRHGERLPLSTLIGASLARAAAIGAPGVDVFAPHAVVSASEQEASLIDGAALAAGLSRRASCGAA